MTATTSSGEFAFLVLFVLCAGILMGTALGWHVYSPNTHYNQKIVCRYLGDDWTHNLCIKNNVVVHLPEKF